MKLKVQVLYFVAAGAVIALSGCATIVNDPNIPLAFSFSDASSGQCTFTNKRGEWSAEIPAKNVMIRRSDDELVYDCSTNVALDARLRSGDVEKGFAEADQIFEHTFRTGKVIHATFEPLVTVAEPQGPGGETRLLDEDRGQDSRIDCRVLLGNFRNRTLDLLDRQFWVTLRNAYAIPDEREDRVGEPVQPPQVPNLVPVFKMQVHPDVKELVGAEAGNEIGFEPVRQQVLA